MNEIEKLDFILLGLYKETKDGGMLSIIEVFRENNQELTIEELRELKIILELKKFAVFQVENRGMDYRVQILAAGIDFVETNSFSTPGISILSLER